MTPLLNQQLSLGEGNHPLRIRSLGTLLLKFWDTQHDHGSCLDMTIQDNMIQTEPIHTQNHIIIVVEINFLKIIRKNGVQKRELKEYMALIGHLCPLGI